MYDFFDKILKILTSFFEQLIFWNELLNEFFQLTKDALNGSSIRK